MKRHSVQVDLYSLGFYSTSLVCAWLIMESISYVKEMKSIINNTKNS